MMLIRKRLRSLIFSQFLIYLSLVFVSMLGITLISALAGGFSSLNSAVDRYVKDYGYPDITITTALNASRTEEVLSGVEGTREINIRKTQDVPAKIGKRLLTVRAFSRQEEARQKFYVYDQAETSGDELSAYIEASFAENNQLGVGDEITLKNLKGWQTVRITGIVSAPECISMQRDVFSWGKNSDFGFIFLEQKDYDKLFPDSPYNQILIYTEEGADQNAVLDEALEEVAAFSPMDSFTYENSPVHQNVKTNLEPLESVSMLIPPIFLGVMLLFISLFLSQVIRRQNKQIAIYAALGYTRSQIAGLFSAFTLSAVLLAVLLGIGSGAALSEVVCRLYAKSFRIPYFPVQIVWEHNLMAILLTICTGIFASLFSVLTVLKAEPTEAMRNIPKQDGKPPFLVRTLFRRTKNLTKVALSSLLRHKGRFLVSVVCISFSFLIIMLGLCFFVSKTFILTNMYDYRMNYDCQVIFHGADAAEQIKKIQGFAETKEAQVTSYASAQLSYQGQEEDSLLCGIEPNSEMVRLIDEQENQIYVSDQGIVLEEHLCEKLGIVVGDMVEINGISCRVTAISSQPISRMQYVSVEQGQKIMDTAPNGVLLNVESEEEETALLEKISELKGYYSATFTRLQYEANLEDFQVLDIGAGIIAVFASLIALLIIYNMSMIALDEKEYDYSILMTMGYTPREVARNLYVQSIVQLLLAAVIGIACGNTVSGMVLAEISTATREYPMKNGAEVCLIVFCVLFFVTTGAHMLSYLKIKKMNPLDRMKNQE